MTELTTNIGASKDFHIFLKKINANRVLRDLEELTKTELLDLIMKGYKLNLDTYEKMIMMELNNGN